EPRIGDPYRTGYVRVPILLKKGTNHLLFAPGRGPVKLAITEPKAAAQLHLGDVTAPDLVVGEPFDVEAAVVVLNASSEPTNDLSVVARAPGGEAIRTTVQ